MSMENNNNNSNQNEIQNLNNINENNQNNKIEENNNLVNKEPEIFLFVKIHTTIYYNYEGGY